MAEPQNCLGLFWLVLRECQLCELPAIIACLSFLDSHTGQQAESQSTNGPNVSLPRVSLFLCVCCGTNCLLQAKKGSQEDAMRAISRPGPCRLVGSSWSQTSKMSVNQVQVQLRALLHLFGRPRSVSAVGLRIRSRSGGRLALGP